MPWSARFNDPISLTDGRKLRTLRDAATHITSLAWNCEKLAQSLRVAEIRVLGISHLL